MQTLSLAVTLFFVLDPFGNLPVMLSLLSRMDEKRRRAVALREALFAFVALAFFYAAGPAFLKLLEIGPADLKVCGGVVLSIISLRMIFPGEGGSMMAKDPQGEPFIVPLAIPLMVGPSAMATVMIMAAQSAENPFVGFGMMTLAWTATAIILLTGVALGAYIPVRLLAALERLTGLLLSVIAVHMLMSGIKTFFATRQ